MTGFGALSKFVARVQAACNVVLHPNVQHERRKEWLRNSVM